MGHLKKYFSADFRLYVWITSPSEYLTETTPKVTLLSTIWRQLSTINQPKSLKPKYIATFPDDTFRTKSPFWNCPFPNSETSRKFKYIVKLYTLVINLYIYKGQKLLKSIDYSQLSSNLISKKWIHQYSFQKQFL